MIHGTTLQILCDKIAYKYHKSKVLTMSRILDYETEYRVKGAITSHYYSSMSKVCNDYKNWNSHKIKELYQR